MACMFPLSSETEPAVPTLAYQTLLVPHRSQTADSQQLQVSSKHEAPPAKPAPCAQPELTQETCPDTPQPSATSSWRGFLRSPSAQTPAKPPQEQPSAAQAPALTLPAPAADPVLPGMLAHIPDAEVHHHVREPLCEQELCEAAGAQPAIRPSHQPVPADEDLAQATCHQPMPAGGGSPECQVAEQGKHPFFHRVYQAPGATWLAAMAGACQVFHKVT